MTRTVTKRDDCYPRCYLESCKLKYETTVYEQMLGMRSII